ncbi:interleukin-36 alpha [Chionomys nivalis]|uniref:interleukin-36 alpha n=1 Tax=Chionomys nivalis TaxID=269649 RepID=UPI00259AAF42|nr:interleukin-36 alpha [Chionomys nivalis]
MDKDDIIIINDKKRKDLHGRAKDWEAWVELRRETPLLRHIQDLSSRVWVLHNDILTAVPRKEQTVPITVTLLPCQYLETLEMHRGEPMYLGLKDPECCLFCTQEGEQPVLRLKEGNILELYSQKESVKSFLFYHNKSGTTSTFESAAFPGWFIAVCSKGSCPLFLTQELGKTHITDFEMIVVE